MWLFQIYLTVNAHGLFLRKTLTANGYNSLLYTANKHCFLSEIMHKITVPKITFLLKMVKDKKYSTTRVLVNSSWCRILSINNAHMELTSQGIYFCICFNLQSLYLQIGESWFFFNQKYILFELNGISVSNMLTLEDTKRSYFNSYPDR